MARWCIDGILVLGTGISGYFMLPEVLVMGVGCYSIDVDMLKVLLDSKMIVVTSVAVLVQAG